MSHPTQNPQPTRRQLAALGLAALLPFPPGGVRANTTGPGRTTVPLFSTAPVGASSVDGWQHQRLPKVARANEHEVVADEGTAVLQIRSAASASTWLARLDVDASERPWLRWRWKVDRALAGSDLRVKTGDDHAARLYVIFDLPLDRLSLGDRLRISAARALSGADLPAAALCYVWGHAQPVGSTAWNPYTDRVRMVVMDSGDARAGRWQRHQRNLAQDWAEAFGGPMPRVAGLAVGADTDNTSDRVTTWFGDLELSATPG
ncbi:DUF3047 domain-containing protein [Sphaerotilus mobilis]|uniref:DUF3047 family protein n=1 Tax=Sphaerotilus mobilis TaxID=47994 RepID=A0A4V2EVF8_9BURK|nr:DUF3047 domain-containing protein [Sphaerotilus mobilis]RZS52340.1 DUF3047 family protein [Sphaerotilus mobilis]